MKSIKNNSGVIKKKPVEGRTVGPDAILRKIKMLNIFRLADCPCHRVKGPNFHVKLFFCQFMYLSPSLCRPCSELFGRVPQN